MPTKEKLESTFMSTFDASPNGMVKAPGRISLLGEHTDYNEGFVLPCALELSVICVFRVRDDKRVRVHSLQYPEYTDHFDLSQDITHCEYRWADYVRGVFYTVRDYGFDINRGLDILISSNLPPDGGLASSAALATSVAGAIAKALNLPLDKRSLALIAQKAEIEFFGKQCGIMDQLTAAMARPDHLLFIDCEDFDVQPVPFPEGMSIVVFSSCAKKQLVGNEYNDLRGECERAAGILGVRSLRHATLDMLYRFESNMNDITFRRARHIISENDRVERVCQAIKASNISIVYKLMHESHESMKHDFEISIPEIDDLVDFCRDALNDDVGTRMTGGGFGGPVIALCRQDQTRSLVSTVTKNYYDRYQINAPTQVFRPAAGMQFSWLNH